MRRARTCKPNFSKSTRDFVSTSASRNDPRRVSSSLHGALPASATSPGRKTGVFFQLVSVRVASDAPGASAEALPCGEPPLPGPTFVSAEARVNGLSRYEFRTPFAPTCVRFRAPPAGRLPIETKPEHARE